MYKTHKASVLSYSQTITAPWLHFAHDFLSNQRSNVRSRTNKIFSRIVFFGEEARCFGLFLFVHVGWDIASQEWFWVAIWLWRIYVLFFSLIENCFFSLFTSFRSLIGNPSFSFFCSFLYFHLFLFFLSISSFSFFSLFFPHPFLWEIGFWHSIRSPLRRFRCPLLRGKEWEFLFYRPRFKKV